MCCVVWVMTRTEILSCACACAWQVHGEGRRASGHPSCPQAHIGAAYSVLVHVPRSAVGCVLWGVLTPPSAEQSGKYAQLWGGQVGCSRRCRMKCLTNVQRGIGDGEDQGQGAEGRRNEMRRQDEGDIALMVLNGEHSRPGVLSMYVFCKRTS